jgi:hypothetical protein
VSFPSNLGLSELLRNLGLTAGEDFAAVPAFERKNVLPVAVMADFSGTMTGDLFEPRGIAGLVATATAGFAAAYILQAGRQAVVEQVRFKTSVAVSTLSVSVHPTDQINAFFGLLPIPPLDVTNIGGSPVLSVFRVVKAAPFGANNIPLEATVQDIPGPSLRALVRGGFSLVLAHSQVNTLSECSILWREIP